MKSKRTHADRIRLGLAKACVAGAIILLIIGQCT
jgi:hypothetical protein